MEEAEYAISMHQPWASLLVHGIKRIEGRSWSTKYRGRLWIHATAHEPSKQIVEVQMHLQLALMFLSLHLRFGAWTSLKGIGCQCKFKSMCRK